MTTRAPDAEVWCPPTDGAEYRYLAEGATYAPDSPWNGGAGRFDNGRRYTLYLANTPEGAVAEFLRRHPEFLGLQDVLRIRVFRVGATTLRRCRDVRDDAKAAASGITIERLTSNDADEARRYRECRELAARSEDGAGITYPSAARQVAGSWCVVLFGEEGDRWSSAGWVEVARPHVNPAEVTPLPS